MDDNIAESLTEGIGVRAMTVGYILLAITITLTVSSIWFWLTYFKGRAEHFEHPADLADSYMQEAGLIGLLFPRSVRRVWNLLIFTICIFVMGTPHHFVVWKFFNHSDANAWLYIHYLWSLVYWIALLAVYSFTIARHQETRRRSFTSKDR